MGGAARRTQPTVLPRSHVDYVQFVPRDPWPRRNGLRYSIELGFTCGHGRASCHAAVKNSSVRAELTLPVLHPIVSQFVRGVGTAPRGSRFGSIWSSILNLCRSQCRNPFRNGSRAVIQKRTGLKTFENNRDRPQEYP